MFHFAIRVYWEDTDAGGIVFYANYLKFFERARTEYLRAHGIHHAEMARDGLAFAVREMTISYDKAAHIDDLLEVETRMAEATAARFVLEQVMSRDGETITRARVVAVLMNDRGRPVRLPKELVALLSGS